MDTSSVHIVPFAPQYKTAFRDLNKAWIEEYFRMEPGDFVALDHPETYILDKGGHILVAKWGEQVAGVCALVKMDHPRFDYELAKMAVDPQFQGKKIGWKLGQAVLDKARSLGAQTVYLESNTILKPAINLYRKLGFVEVPDASSPYERSNIQMQCKL